MILRSAIAGGLALACVFAFGTTAAEARHRHHSVLHLSSSRTTAGPMTCDTDGRCTGGGALREFSSLLPMRGTGLRVAAGPSEIVPHPAGCPRVAFCGCGAAVHLLGAPIRALWLAANWFKFPRAAPAPGMAAVRQHHVFAIERVLGNGLVLAYDANSGGHLTRIHVRSLAGYRVVDPRGGYKSL